MTDLNTKLQEGIDTLSKEAGLFRQQKVLNDNARKEMLAEATKNRENIELWKKPLKTMINIYVDGKSTSEEEDGSSKNPYKNLGSALENVPANLATQILLAGDQDYILNENKTVRLYNCSLLITKWSGNSTANPVVKISHIERKGYAYPSTFLYLHYSSTLNFLHLKIELLATVNNKPSYQLNGFIYSGWQSNQKIGIDYCELIVPSGMFFITPHFSSGVIDLHLGYGRLSGGGVLIDMRYQTVASLISFGLVIAEDTFIFSLSQGGNIQTRYVGAQLAQKVI